MGAEASVPEPEDAEAAEQPDTDLLPENVAKMSYNEFNAALAGACREDDFRKYRDLWKHIDQTRSDNTSFDDALLADGGLKHLKYAFRHSDALWREAGVRMARTFFHNREAREKLVALDFVGSMMLLTMPKDGVDLEDDGGLQQGTSEEQFQLLAAETILEMADYSEFMPSLCSTSVLNFLCIALNQVPPAVETVTHTFVKISADPLNLPVFLGGSVGDILEAFFKSTSYSKPNSPEKLKQWERNIVAMAFCAHTMGTMIKYDHACQVDLPTVGAIFTSMPDNLRLVSELARLFYWICRKSKDLWATLLQTAPGGNTDGLDSLLFALVETWKRAVDLHRRLQKGSAQGLEDFLVDDMDRDAVIEYGSEEFQHKVEYAEMRLCYMNCLLWVLLPQSHLRWRLQDLQLRDLHLAVELEGPVFLQVILGTIRFLLDQEQAQQCQDLVTFFGEQLLGFLDQAIDGRFPDSLMRLLLDGVSILSLQREMQKLLATFNIYGKLNRLVRRYKDRNVNRDHRKIELAVLRVMSQVAVHPAHRLGWIAKDLDPDNVYPPRDEFEGQLEGWIKKKDEHCKTIASLLLNLFQEQKFQRDVSQVETTLLSVLDWWQVNSTTFFDEREEVRPVVSLEDRLKQAAMRVMEKRALTSMETMAYCAPYESVVVLSLFSRLALEPKFKRFFYQHALETLLCCVCTGIAAEAREAAATLANLMWVPDLDQERLVCWLKFDGSRCLTVDSANVLLPVRFGDLQPVDIGQGMYKSTWGVEFVYGSCLTLHPDGFKTYNVPGLLTTASPQDTFRNSSQSPYHWLDDPPDPRHFTVSCWFFWPLSQADEAARQCVLLQSSPPERMIQIYVDFELDPEGVWTIIDHTRTKRPIKTPKLNHGWHLLTLVSSTYRSPAQNFDGTKLFLDEWCKLLKNVWILNDFYVLGNDLSRGGRKPFGLIADFRIYARSLSDDEVHKMVLQATVDDHPNKVVARLAQLGAAEALAQRLEVPDTAAECLRALGSLASLASQRAMIFHVCGRQLLRFMSSPLPMVQRQAKRLMNNLS
mmetsp:Transcript_110737/g.264164  ORF Transcript_110737/g.264164 Transcript_110737/m.264164 type:complete len:1042 (+) Transcript_110737:96-3221(+)|eukprot:CAMPEP_0181424884 /NCGR_PEP_ID=MMETSP1110-20121109/14875_1 /TAXON_ID=174948 /ORGANISM="Symbiodinium sp., Strain CCMP421" /LENGTH=1041 /DNA_ID=CAMNT_0023548057 /DNA_START=134 /DNA_END=3259 /DNA_ORIENTATION=-